MFNTYVHVCISGARLILCAPGYSCQDSSGRSFRLPTCVGEVEEHLDVQALIAQLDGKAAINPKILLAVKGRLCDNYVMRSTRNVVDDDEDTGLGHYSDPPLLVLASLASGPKHGHAMIEDIARLCGTRLGPGTLYGAIARLEQQRWIAPLPPDERRRPYRITAEGQRVLRARLTTLKQFAKAGLGRLEPL